MKDLETKNLILRPFNANDETDFFELLKDTEIKNLFVKFRFKEAITLMDTKSMLYHFDLSHSKGDCRYAIMDKESGELIGGLLSNSDNTKTSLDISIFIKNNMRKKGFAKESIIVFIEYMKTLGYKNICFEILKQNTNSIQLLSSIENMGDLGVTLHKILFDKYDYRGNAVEEKEAELSIINETEVIITWEKYSAQIFSTNGQEIGYIKIEIDEVAKKLIIIISFNNNISQFEMNREQIIKLHEDGLSATKYIKSRLYTIIKQGKFIKYQNGDNVFYPYNETDDNLLSELLNNSSAKKN